MGAGRQGQLGRLSWRTLTTVVAAVALRRAAQKKRPQRGGHAEAVISSDALGNGIRHCIDKLRNSNDSGTASTRSAFAPCHRPPSVREFDNTPARAAVEHSCQLRKGPTQLIWLNVSATQLGTIERTYSQGTLLERLLIQSGAPVSLPHQHRGALCFQP